MSAAGFSVKDLEIFPIFTTYLPGFSPATGISVTIDWSVTTDVQVLPDGFDAVRETVKVFPDWVTDGVSNVEQLSGTVPVIFAWT